MEEEEELTTREIEICKREGGIKVGLFPQEEIFLQYLWRIFFGSVIVSITSIYGLLYHR